MLVLVPKGGGESDSALAFSRGDPGPKLRGSGTARARALAKSAGSAETKQPLSVALQQLEGKALAALDLGERRRRSDARHPGGAQSIGHASVERRLRAYDCQRRANLLRKGGHRGWVSELAHSVALGSAQRLNSRVVGRAKAQQGW